MLRPFQGILALLGRILLAAIFLSSAVMNKVPNFGNVANDMAKQGIPAPNVMLVGAIVFLVVGSLSLIAGFYTRIGALLLLVFLALAAYFYHDFWTIQATTQELEQMKQNEMAHFMKNVAMMGAMLLVIANGPGPMSLDAEKK